MRGDLPVPERGWAWTGNLLVAGWLQVDGGEKG